MGGTRGLSKPAGGRLVTCELHAGPVKCSALLVCMHTNANHLSLTHWSMKHMALVCGVL